MIPEEKAKMLIEKYDEWKSINPDLNIFDPDLYLKYCKKPNQKQLIMTPKEKAKELIKKLSYELGKSNLVTKELAFNDEVKIMDFTKQCALICVDELKKQSLSFDYGLSVSQSQYLEEVKQEIKNL